MSSYREAIRVGCPRCHAKKGEPCVYVAPGYLVPSTQRYADRAGKPMVHLHYQRYKVVALRRVRSVTLERPVRYPDEARRALLAFDRREHERMVAWLRANAHIFWTLGSTREGEDHE